MRFKCSVNKTNLQILINILTSLSRITVKAAVNLSPTHMRIASITNQDISKCYTEINIQSFYLDYIIESLNNNNLLFEINLSNFIHALSSGKDTNVIVMKLVKRNQLPCLCIEMTSNNNIDIDITHDIPIDLLPVDHIIKHKPPDVPPPQVSLELQSINKLFRVVIERMSKLSKNLHIVAYQSGKLILATSQQINLKVKTYFTDVTPRYDTFEPVSGMNIMETYNQNVAEVKLDIKKLSTVLLFFNSIPYTNVIGFFSTNEMLVINIELAPLGLGTVTYFIPVIVLSEEEEEDSSEEED